MESRGRSSLIFLVLVAISLVRLIRAETGDSDQPLESDAAALRRNARSEQHERWMLAPTVGWCLTGVLCVYLALRATKTETPPPWIGLELTQRSWASRIKYDDDFDL
mmetsp:Transcript_50476/g.80111  ORF Transcript_50476/g.80111 Transcript_50476/m.80111 type:complete len:107 (-) Transcript_50476:85-405(-)